MSLKNLFAHLNTFFRHNRSAGIEIFQDEKGIGYHAVLLEQKKNEVLVAGILHTARDVHQLTRFTGKDIPVYLILNTKGILHRTVPVQDQPSSLLQAVLPSARSSDFYLQQTAMENGTLASVIRKNILHHWVAQLQEAGILVTGVGLGPFCIQTLLPFLSQKQKLATTAMTLYFTRDQQLQRLEPGFDPGKTLLCGGEPLRPQLLPAYAAAFSLWSGEAFLIPDIPRVKENRSELLWKRICLRSVKVATGLLAAVWLAALLVQFMLNAQIRSVRSEWLNRQVLLQQMDTLQQRYLLHRELLEKNNILQTGRAPYYADRIAASLLPGLQLTELEIFPLSEQTMDPKELPTFRCGEIRITGRSFSGEAYNDWLRFLQEAEWTKQVQSLQYRDLSGREGVFEVKVEVQ